MHAALDLQVEELKTNINLLIIPHQLNIEEVLVNNFVLTRKN